MDGRRAGTWTRAGALATCSLVLAIAASQRAPRADAAAPAGRTALAPAPHRVDRARLPLAFEENRGQTDSRVRFTARAKGLTAFVTPEETVFALHSGRPDGEGDELATEVIRMRFVGADESPRVEGREPLPGKCNYFLGNDPSRWVTDAPTCARVVVRDVYPGIDQHWYGGADGRLRYDLVVAPGADPADVAFVLDGTRDLRIGGAGTLCAATGRGELRQDAPVAFQFRDGDRCAVDARFVVTPEHHVRLAIGVYDSRLPLVIDPPLTYSTYLGGSLREYGNAIAVDANGAAYVAGWAESANFPTQSGFQGTGGQPCGDGFVTKYGASGSVVYSTYLGGSNCDECAAIALDGSGAAYVTGKTGSTNFPTQNALQAARIGGQDVFVTKLNATGSALIYSTYLGGGGSSDYDEGRGIAVDSTGAAYVTGSTGSTSFPTASPLQGANAGSGGAFEAFITKFNPSGSALVYSTYLGGSGGDWTSAIAVDASGSAYVTGATGSANFPTQSPIQSSWAGDLDAFVTKVNASGSALVYSSFLGGAGRDCGWGIAIDASGAAHVVGETASTNFPTQSPFQSAWGGTGVSCPVNPCGEDGFVTKVNASGSALVYSTYLGGTHNDVAYDVAVDAAGVATVVGGTSSSNFPTVSSLQSYTSSPVSVPRFNEAFVTQFNSAGSALVFSTFLGGSSEETASGVALDATGAIHVSGWSASTTFPLQSAAQGSYGGGTRDAFVSKIGGTAGPLPPPPPVPAAPIDLVATYVKGEGVLLAWTDTATDEAGFRIERKPANFAFSLFETTGANVTSSTDTTPLFPKTTYTYRVRAFNANGSSAWSNEASVTTSVEEPLPGPPVAPTLLTASVVEDIDGSPLVELSWQDNSTDEVRFDVTRFEGGAAARGLTTTAPDVAFASDSDLHPGWPYTYRVRALSLLGPSPWSNDATATVPATFDVTVVSGSLKDSPKLRGDKIKKLSGTYTMPTADAVLDPIRDGLELQLGPVNAPLSVSIVPADPDWKQRGGKRTWKSAKRVTPKVAVVVDTVRHTFTVTISGAEFASRPASLVRVLIACGGDGGGQTSAWVAGKPGAFRLK